jgi:HEAT repeat protein
MKAPILVTCFGLLVVACAGPQANPQQEARIAELIQQLHARESVKRIDAATALMRIGPAAKSAVPALVENLKADPGEASMMINALLRIGPGAALPALVDALDSSDREVASNAAFAIGGFGRAARPVIPALLKALENPRTRSSAAAALDYIQQP